MTAVMDAFSIGVVLLSVAGDLLAINRAAMDLFEVPAEMRQRAVPKLVVQLALQWPDGRPVALDETPFARALRGEIVRDVVMSIAPPGEERRWLEIGAAPLGPPGPVHTVVATIVDVTRKREADEERQLLLGHLLGDVVPAIERIVVSARRIRDAARGEAVGTGAGEIIRAARRVSASLHEIETALRFDAGAITSEPELVDVKAFLLDLLERTSDLDVSSVVPSMPSGLPRAHVDPDHLERILVELLRGALAGAAAGTDVVVAGEAAGGRLWITVGSSGQDIAPGELPRVFDRFFRSRGRPVGRLHVVRSLVEANHGHVTAESGAGRGLAIRVGLPLRPR